MTLHLKMPSKVNNLSPKISVIGVGGAGGNVINSMIKSGIDGVSFLTVNTDSQALKNSESPETLQLGPSCTQGLGAGADPEIGRDSAVEVESEITGRVWKIVTETGTKVSEGDTLLILESMKMEIPVESPCNGTVLKILLKEGDSVNEDQVVVIVDTTT